MPETKLKHKKIQLPGKFKKPVRCGSLLLIAYVYALILAPSALNILIFQYADWPLLASILLSIPLFFLASQGYHLLGFLGHEGFHNNLHSNKWVSAILGIITSSATVVFLQIGVAIDHWNHHRYANTDKDPDFRLFDKYKTFVSRLLLTRSHANRTFVNDTFKLIQRKPLDMSMKGLPFSKEDYRLLAWLNIICNLSWLSFYIYVAYFVSWQWILLGVLIPLLAVNIYSSMRPYIEHANTGQSINNFARSRTHWLFTWLYAGNNFHFEHHLYPGVPCYKLPAVHRYLIANNWIDKDNHVYDHNLLSSYKYAFADYVYGRLD